jgi:hypothetical protein
MALLRRSESICRGLAASKARRDRKIALLRRMTTGAQYRHSLGGRLKRRDTRKPVTLPRLKCLEQET